MQIFIIFNEYGRIRISSYFSVLLYYPEPEQPYTIQSVFLAEN
jgi:hypothetical protein